jgi:ribose transport system substrate-binding protein
LAGQLRIGPQPPMEETMLKKPLLLATAVLLATAAPVAAKDLKSVGITVGDLGNPFFGVIVKGAKDKVKELAGPDAKVTVVSSNFDLGTQFSQIDNFIASGVDMVLLTAADPVAIAPAVARMKAAGIVAVAVDSYAKGADVTVATNNIEAGQKACQYIVDKLQGKGDVIIMNGPPVSAVTDRVTGCKEVFGKNPGIKILSDNQNGKASREGGLAVMTGLLTHFSKIDAVFSINDPQAVGADLAAKQLGRKEFFITSVDGAPDIEAALKQPGNLIEASATQDPYAIAQTGIELGHQIIQGKTPAQTTVLIPSILITRDNVGQYKGWLSH